MIIMLLFIILLLVMTNIFLFKRIKNIEKAANVEHAHSQNWRESLLKFLNEEDYDSIASSDDHGGISWMGIEGTLSYWIDEAHRLGGEDAGVFFDHYLSLKKMEYILSIIERVVEQNKKENDPFWNNLLKEAREKVEDEKKKQNGS